MWTSGNKDGLRNFKKILNNVKGDARDELKAKFIRNLGYKNPAGVTDDIEDFPQQNFLQTGVVFPMRQKVLYLEINLIQFGVT